MRTINDFADERYKGFRSHCEAFLAEMASRRDHVPSQVLLDRLLSTNVHFIGLKEAVDPADHIFIST